MALVEIRRYSDTCEKRVGLHVILPDVGEPPYPVLYLLHGLSDDYTGWVRKSRLEHYLREWPLIVALPDGYRSWYARAERGFDFERYLTEETVDYLDRFFPTRPERAIGGLSMGGYGALRGALGRRGRFRSASSHSGALVPWDRQPPFPNARELEDVFGLEPSGSGHDLFTLAGRPGPVPALWLDIGLDDAPWLGCNRRFHRHLEGLSIPHQYHEFPGGHDWDYWDLHLREALRFHAGNLGVEPLPLPG